MVDTKFFVNKDKRTVVCVISTINDIPQRLAKYNLSYEKYDDAEEIRTYTGYAYCAPEDEWNETYGKHLAEYRASKLRQSDVNREIKKFIKGISKCIDNLYDYGLLKDPHFPDK